MMTSSYGLLLNDFTYVSGYVAMTALLVRVTLIDCVKSRQVQLESVV